MSSVVVYVFLLDNLAGFNSVLNDTLTNFPHPNKNSTSNVQKCDASTTKQILKAVGQELKIEVVPSFNVLDNSISQESAETLLNDASPDASSPVLDGNDEYFVKTINSLEHNVNQDYEFNSDELAAKTTAIIEINTESNNKVVETTVNVNKTDELPNLAPFLVAIFETLTNTTAQTCAGTLIAPRWVVTASDCLNILSNLYSNNTNGTENQSRYTVVAGAKDPLSDGSVHNVTTVITQHGYWHNSSLKRNNTNVDLGAYLALLEIEPEFEGAHMDILEEKVKKGHVMIYGWVMFKDDSDVEYLKLMSMSALILSSAECQAMYNYNNNDVLCLFNNEKDRNITQLSSGGPVLMLQKGEMRMLAVVQTDEHVYIGYPLYAHYSWMKKILQSK